jgi:type I restriction enzyme S subunit
MKSNYKKLGKYIQQVSIRNSDLTGDVLLGVSIQKILIPSIANIVGTNMSTYKKIKKNQFAYGPVTSRNGDKISIAICEVEKAILSQAYTIFEIIDENELLPEYLMMWFRRAEFDRYARFKSHGSARETFDWDEMCEIELPVPSLEKQQEIVNEYKTIQKRIKLNENLIQKLEETAQAIYKSWFVEGIDLENLPEGWTIKKLEEFTKMKYGKMLDSSLFLQQGYPVFSGYGVRGFYSQYMYMESQILVLCRGVSGTGEVKLSPKFSYITNLSIVVEIENALISKMYLYYFLKNSDLRSLDSGSAQSMITTGDLYFYEAIIPPFELQAKFEKAINFIIDEIEVRNNEIQKLVQLKDLLLSKMTKVEEIKELRNNY